MLLKLREYSWIIFLPLSLLWAGIVTFRRFAFRSFGYRSRFPVICVGNLHSGGTGKTPVVAEIASYYASKNSVILSRGYKRLSKAPVLELGPHSLEGPAHFGDEPWLLHKKTQRPVFVGGRRSRLAKAVERKFKDAILVLDDGFQHMGLVKDISVIVINTQTGFLDSFCFPAGELREPLSSLSYADAVILVDAGEKESFLIWETFLQDHFSEIPVFAAKPKSGVLANESLGRDSAAAFCGIANPERFIKTVSQGGLGTVVKSFKDHHQYREKDMEWLISERQKSGAGYFLTTEKDYYKVVESLSSRCEKVTFLKYEIMLPKEFWLFIDSRIGEAA